MSNDTSYTLAQAEEALCEAMESVATMWQQLNSNDFKKNYEGKNGRGSYQNWRERALTAYDFKSKAVDEIRLYIKTKFGKEYRSLSEVTIAIRERDLKAPDWMRGDEEAREITETQAVEEAREEIVLSLQSQAQHDAILERLQAARKQANLTQEEVGSYFEVTKTTIGSWERGQAPVTLVNIFKLAAIYSVDPLYILTGAEEIKREELEAVAKYLDITVASLKALL
jgi:DNA-binding XRE family transcriptional regulator